MSTEWKYTRQSYPFIMHRDRFKPTTSEPTTNKFTTEPSRPFFISKSILKITKRKLYYTRALYKSFKAFHFVKAHAFMKKFYSLSKVQTRYIQLHASNRITSTHHSQPSHPWDENVFLSSGTLSNLSHFQSHQPCPVDPLET